MNELYLMIFIMFFAFCIVFSRVLQNILSEKYKTQTKIAKIKAQKAKTTKSTAASEPVYPDWLLDLGEEFGVDLEEYLGMDEMPPELERLMPLAKSFVKSGGLSKLLKSQGETQKSDETSEDFI